MIRGKLNYITRNMGSIRSVKPVRLLSSLVEMIHIILYKEESKGLKGPVKVSIRWPMLYYVT